MDEEHSYNHVKLKPGPTVRVTYKRVGKLAARVVADQEPRGEAGAPDLLTAARAALQYMRMHKYADQAWADDLESAIAASEKNQMAARIMSDQEPLGEEFEAVWDANKGELYEP